MKSVAIVPAFNEAPTLGAVLRALCEADCLSAVLVVSDGSTDATCDVARSFGCATVACNERNAGKGQAMRAGLARTDAEAVLFVDADLYGLRPDHVRRLVGAVAGGPFDQSCGLRDQGSDLLNRMQLRSPLITTGERCVRRTYLDRIPARFWNGYAIEVAINEAVLRHRGTTWLTVLDGVSIRPKEAKVDVATASAAYGRMFRQVAEAWADARREPF